ncbi:MAG: GTPase HflX [bacterium]|nr:MAG: GTPase HflX [bacterium]
MRAAMLKGLQRIYRRKIPAGKLITDDLLLYFTKLSHELGRQLGMLIDRRGKPTHVIIGDDSRIVIPDIGHRRLGGRRLTGLRCIHTHIKREPITQDDLNDLMLLRLDLMVVVEVLPDGAPGKLTLAHMAPGMEKPCKLHGPESLADTQKRFEGLITEIESGLERQSAAVSVKKRQTAMLIHVSGQPKQVVESSMDELEELARTAGIHVADRVTQKRKPDPRYLMGKGKLREFMIRALSHSIDVVIFDTELTPGQLKAVTDFTDIEVMDRTQLILTIFERRAKTSDGKLRVRLAQMRYLLPRLSAKESALSRIRGGIGLRGPGETTAETQRRHLQERIARLGRELEVLSAKRAENRKLRKRSEVKTVSIIGYTNAGKSTLLNRLAGGGLYVEDLLFSTLDPSARKVRLPSGVSVVVSDTVGLIRDMPPSLTGVFRATLEELAESDLLILLADMSDPHFEEHIKLAEQVFREIGLQHLPRIMVFNKLELVDPETTGAICRRHSAYGISAKENKGIKELLEAVGDSLSWRRSSNGRTTKNSA